MQNELKDLIDRYFKDIVETSESGDTSNAQNNNSNTTFNNNIQNITARCSETDSNEISSTLAHPTSQESQNINTLGHNSSNNVSGGNIQEITEIFIPIGHTGINVMETTDTSLEHTTSIGILQNININTLQQRLQDNVPDNNNPQETHENIPIQQTIINVMNDTAFTPQNIPSIENIPIINPQINIMADNTTTPEDLTSVQHPRPNIVTQMTQTTPTPNTLTAEKNTNSRTGKHSNTKKKNQTTEPQNNTQKPQKIITVQNRKRTKVPYTPYEITITERDRVNCTISQETFFSSAQQPRIGRGQNTTPICRIREIEELTSDEIDLYIGHLNDKFRQCKNTKVLILNVDFYIMALRYIVQEEDEFNAAPFATPNDDMTQYGELVEKRPLLEPYNKQNEIRYTTLVESFPTADDFKNFQKVCCNIITHTNIYIFPTILT